MSGKRLVFFNDIRKIFKGEIVILYAMRPRPFSLYRPQSLKEASEILYSHEDAKALAGGQSLIPMMKLRIYSPKEIVMISHLPELRANIWEEGDTIFIKSMTTHDMVHRSGLLRSSLPLLSEAAGTIADQQIRNRGTIGGNVAHADPATNLSSALLALNATVLVSGPKGEREIPIDGFFVDAFTTALEPGEIITGFKIEKQRNSRQKFMKIARSDTTWPMALVAVNLKMSEGFVEDARIALGVAAPTPIRAVKAEKYLVKKVLDDETILKAAELATEDLRPPGDVHASPEYRKHLLKVLVKRSLSSLKGGAS